MRTFAKRALWGVAIAGGITLLGATAANAAETDGEDGILSGTQAVAPVSVPVDLSGNAISLLGSSSTDVPASAPVETAPAPDPAPAAETDGADGAASGTQAVITVDIPVTVQDTSVSVLGESDVAAPADAPVSGEPAAPAPTPAVTTSGADSLLSGTQALLDVNVPITVTGNAVSALDPSAETAVAADEAAPAASTPSSAPAPNTDGADGIASGSQVVAPIAAPVTIDGNAIGLLGDSAVTRGDSTSTGTTSPADGTTPTTDGTDGTASGTQVAAPVTAPVNATGNAIGLLGDSTATSGDAITAAGTTTPTAGDGILTGGSDSVLGGTQLALPISAPITVGGNAVGLIGDATVDTPASVPGTDPGTDPGTVPGTNPGTDPGTNPGTDTDPGTTPGTDSGATPVPSGQGGNIAAAGGVMLAQTGADTPFAPALLATMMLLIGTGLLRRRVAG